MTRTWSFGCFTNRSHDGPDSIVYLLYNLVYTVVGAKTAFVNFKTALFNKYKNYPKVNIFVGISDVKQLVERSFCFAALRSHASEYSPTNAFQVL